MHRVLLPAASLVLAPLAYSGIAPAPFLLGGEYQLDSDIDGGGSFSRSVARARVSAPLYLKDDTVLAISAGYQFESFDFDDLLASPWGEINRSRLGLIAKQDIGNDWSWLALPYLSSNSETEADFSESFTFGALGAAWYKVSDTLTLGFGAGFSTEIEDKVSAFPILVIDWEFAKNWTLTTVPPDGFRLGPGANLRWDVSDHMNLALIYQYQSNKHRLNDDLSFAADGVGELRQHRAALAATYYLGENLHLTGHVGLAFGGELELKDSSGDSITERDFDSTLVFGFEGSYRF